MCGSICSVSMFIWYFHQRLNPAADALMPSYCAVLQEDHLAHWELIVTTGMRRVGLSTPVFTPTHLNGSWPSCRIACWSIPVLKCPQKRRQRGTGKDINTQHALFIFIPSACALFFIHTANTVLLVAPATKRDVNSYSLPFTHHAGSFVFVCGCRERTTRATRVELLHWPDKSWIEQSVKRAARGGVSAGRGEQEWKMEIEHTHFKRGRLGFNQSCLHWSIGIKWKDVIR